MLFRTLPPHGSALSVGHPRGRSRSPAAGRRAAEPPALALSNAACSLEGIWGRAIDRFADMAVARDWLRFCRRSHSGRCQPPPAAGVLPGFRLIDCAQTPPRVVPASLDDEYTALSYVAGEHMAEPWPRLVLDAAAVTRDLGMRYLWVDRPCLDGVSPEHRALQVARMDDVFEQAAVTIIAADGDGTMQGLSGVNGSARRAQPRYRFANANVTLVSSLKDPQFVIERSTWHTRGWTYQEGLLARRRLVFTDQQMYWECDGMLCPETLALPLDYYHDAQQQRMYDFVRPGLLNRASYVDGSWHVWKKLPNPAEEPSIMSVFRAADQHIIEYTKRTLRHDQDSLSAFLGLSRHLDRTLGRGRLGDVGIPIWAPASQGADVAAPGPNRTKELFALSTSFWHHKRGAGEVVRRRSHLPSWSWAGWKGAVELFSILVADPEGGGKDRKLLSHHYVSATQLARNEQPPPAWTYSPNLVVLRPDGSVAYDFAVPGKGSAPRLAQDRYVLRVCDPLVLDRVKARAHGSAWLFNDVSVDARLSRGRGTEPADTSGLREYVARYARGEQVTVLWFVEEATVMLLVVERSATTAGRWERVGRARMAFTQEPKEVVRRFGRLEVMLNYLPLRRLGEDMLIE